MSRISQDDLVICFVGANADQTCNGWAMVAAAALVATRTGTRDGGKSLKYVESAMKNHLLLSNAGIAQIRYTKTCERSAFAVLI